MHPVGWLLVVFFLVLVLGRLLQSLLETERVPDEDENGPQGEDWGREARAKWVRELQEDEEIWTRY